MDVKPSAQVAHQVMHSLPALIFADVVQEQSHSHSGLIINKEAIHSCQREGDGWAKQGGNRQLLRPRGVSPDPDWLQIRHQEFIPQRERQWWERIRVCPLTRRGSAKALPRSKSKAFGDLGGQRGPGTMESHSGAVIFKNALVIYRHCTQVSGKT